jgi:hypothetical protein
LPSFHLLCAAAARELEGFAPKSAKDFEEFGKLVAGKHLLAHAKSPSYKAAVKALLKVALSACTSQEIKDVETCVAGEHAPGGLTPGSMSDEAVLGALLAALLASSRGLGSQGSGQQPVSVVCQASRCALQLVVPLSHWAAALLQASALTN